MCVCSTAEGITICLYSIQNVQNKDNLENRYTVLYMKYDFRRLEKYVRKT